VARQLGLFKGSRQRGVSLKPPKEFALHCVLADMLHRWCMPDWRYTHLPMGEYRDPATANRLQRMGVTRGWPDFLFVGPSLVCWLELKRKNGILSEEQIACGTHLVNSGHHYLCTSDIREAVAWLKGMGILRANVNV
jgi:hypothetical protein